MEDAWAELPSRPAIQHCRLEHSKSPGSRAVRPLTLGNPAEYPTAARSTCLDPYAIHKSSLKASRRQPSPAQRNHMHAPNALRAILSTGLAPQFTIGNLYRALRTQDCSECGSFGAYLHLLDCRRYYWLCVAEAINILPITRL